MTHWRVVALAAAAAVFLASCGSPGYTGKKVATLRTEGPAKATPVRSDEDKIREFEKCMEDNGIRFPKNEEEARNFQPDEQAMRDADEDCRHFLPNGGQPPPLDPKQLDEMRQQAKCMREHGIDVPDPDPNNPYPAFGGNGTDQDALQKALEACMGGKVTIATGGPEPTK